MKLEVIQEPALCRLTVRMEENCHGDSTPPAETVHFNGVNERIAPDTAALAAAIVASRWCGELLDFGKVAIGADVAEAARLIVADARFVMPIDGYRQQLCEGHMDLLVAPTAMAGLVLSAERGERILSRLVTWSGEFVERGARTSAGHVAGEVSTNADLLLTPWETSIALGLFVGGSRLRSIVVPRPDAEEARDFERFGDALRIVGVQLRAAGPAARLPASLERARDRKLQPARKRAAMERDFSPAK